MQLEHPSAIQKRYRHVYFSPHLDDVVFSCAGRILKQIAGGEPVLVVSVFTGRPAPHRIPRSTALRSLADTDRRRKEDREAMSRLGVDFLWLGFPDFIFRHPKASFFRFIPFLFRKGPSEKMLESKLENRIVGICERAGAGHAYIPMAVGHHVDHQILFRIGARLTHTARGATTIHFFEETPYVFFPLALEMRMSLGFPFDISRQSLRSGARDHWFTKVRSAYRNMLDVPSLQLDRPILKPGLFVFLAAAGLFAQIQLGRRKRSAHRFRLVPHPDDVTAVAVGKQRAARAYSFKTGSSIWRLTVLEKSFGRYSRSIGANPGQHLERCWTPVSNTSCNVRAAPYP